MAQAEIYRWTDARVRVYFGSKAQAGSDADIIVVQPQIIERDQATGLREARVENSRCPAPGAVASVIWMMSNTIGNEQLTRARQQLRDRVAGICA